MDPNNIKVEEKKIEYDPNSVEYQMQLMGIPVGFNTTKGNKVESNSVGAASIKKKRRHKQYMNINSHVFRGRAENFDISKYRDPKVGKGVLKALPNK